MRRTREDESVEERGRERKKERKKERKEEIQGCLMLSTNGRVMRIMTNPAPRLHQECIIFMQNKVP